jgi:hypothetical protein
MLPIAFEKAGGDIDLQFRRERLHREDAWVFSDGFGGFEPAEFLFLAEIRPFKQFGRQDDLRAMLRRLADMRLNRGEVGGKRARERALDGGDGDGLGHAKTPLRRALARCPFER